MQQSNVDLRIPGYAFHYCQDTAKTSCALLHCSITPSRSFIGEILVMVGYSMPPSNPQRWLHHAHYIVKIFTNQSRTEAHSLFQVFHAFQPRPAFRRRKAICFTILLKASASYRTTPDLPRKTMQSRVHCSGRILTFWRFCWFRLPVQAVAACLRELITCRFDLLLPVFACGAGVLVFRAGIILLYFSFRFFAVPLQFFVL